MAQVKEPYGLVYNTDGSLCVTYRDDDIPFAGVRSFAVETATTNLLGNTVFDTAIFTATAMGIGTILNHLPGKGLYGSMLTRATKSDNMTGSNILAARDTQTLFIPQAGKTYTYSVYARLYGKQSNRPFYLAHYDGNLSRIDVGLLTPEWKKYSYTFTVRPEYTGGGLVIYNWLPHSSVEVGSGFEICLPQIEQKPFATSFVDGSRPRGGILFEDMQELEYDNFVFTCWANYRSVSPSWQFVTTIFTPDNALASEANHYSIRRRSDGIVYLKINYDLGDSSIGHTELTEGWHFFLIAVHDGYTDFWIDDAKYTSSKYVVNSKDKNIYLGYWPFTVAGYPWQNTIANVFVGKYKKPNGTIIWTDDYIREVYEAQIPFPESNKLSIY